MAGTIIDSMSKNIRIKPYFHILEKDGIVSFIKTLDESIRIPSGKMIDTIVHAIQQNSNYEIVCNELCTKLSITQQETELLIGKFLEIGVLEWYDSKGNHKPGRYHRQELLFDAMTPEADSEAGTAQNKLAETHVTILGIGGIGNYIAMALAAAGVGKLTLVDFDVVELSNMNRQVLFQESDIGKPKIPAAVNHLKSLNSSIQIRGFETKIQSQEELEKLVAEKSPVHYLVLSADHPPHLVLWASALCKKHQFKYIKCGYMAHQGLVGPLLGPDTRQYEELFESWKPVIESQPMQFKLQNDNYIAPSMAATNAILANIAALELVKDITGITDSCLKEKRMLVNLKTMEVCFG